MKRLAGVLLGVLAAGCVTARRAAAQTEVTRLIGVARQQIEDLFPDSAFATLQRALQGQATAVERVAAFKLLGVTQLTRGDRVSALLSFEQALRLDAAARADDIADLHSDVRVVFGEARTALGISDAPRVDPAGPRLTVAADVPPDTVVPANGRLRIEVRPSYRARVVLTMSPADAPATVLWTDTAVVGGIGTRAWNVRAADGEIVAPGRYALRATAADSINQVSLTVERILVVSRVPADTQPLPAPLDASAFAPETLHLRRGAPSTLVWGLALGGAIAGASQVLGNPDVNKGLSADGTAYAVAGGVTLAGVVSWMTGRRTRPLPENTDRNRQLVANHRQQGEAIARANAAAREGADVRVTLERTGP